MWREQLSEHVYVLCANCAEEYNFTSLSQVSSFPKMLFWPIEKDGLSIEVDIKGLIFRNFVKFQEQCT